MYHYNGYPLFALYSPGAKLFLLAALIWSLVWKGVALWKAGRSGQKGWFVALFLINTLGLLEISYIVWFSKKSSAQKE